MRAHSFALAAFAALTSFVNTSANGAQDEHAAHQHDMHTQHQHMPSNQPQDEQPVAKRSVVTLKLPNVMLQREDGEKIKFNQAMQDTKPVYVNFIYTSCTAICPAMSQLFAGLQKRLGNESGKVNMVSISIDPEYDTPVRLSEYARRYKAGQQWHFYTGTVEASTALQKAFNVYNADKMNHTVVTFFRANPGSAWVRLDGFVMPEQLLQEYTSSKTTGHQSHMH